MTFEARTIAVGENEQLTLTAPKKFKFKVQQVDNNTVTVSLVADQGAFAPGGEEKQTDLPDDVLAFSRDQGIVEYLKSAIKAAQGNFFPTVTSTATYSYSGIEFPLVYNWSVAGTVNIPIFSGFLTKQQVAQARANLLTTKANGDVLRQTILLEVSQALLNLEAARQRLRVTEVTVEQAKERMALVEGRYKAGLSNAVEVTVAEVALVNAQANEVVAMSGYQAAKAQLDRAMGLSAPGKGGP